MLSYSTLFCYNTDEVKEIDSRSGLLCVWCLHVLRVSTWVSPGPRGSSHIPKMCILGELMCLGCRSLSECVCERERVPEMGRHPVHGSVPPGALSFWERLWPLMTLNWDKHVGK